MSCLALCLLGPPRVELGGELVHIDRIIYHGAHPDGTEIRFESFQLHGLDR
jgi:hypothetical protein